MIEVIWHGRGGQGAFTAARLLGTAATLQDGSYALAFPSFGPERRGAPMRAFTKIANTVIGDRSAVTKADFVVYLDDTLLGSHWERELKPGGKVLVNSAAAARFDDERIIAFDANALSKTHLGREIPNTALLGALAALVDEVAIEQILDAVQSTMAPRLVAKNQAVVRAAYEALGAQRVDEVTFDFNEARVDTAQAQGVTMPQADTEAWLALVNPVQVPRENICIPQVSPEALAPANFAQTTCFRAGHLDHTNAGWRSVRPVVDSAACTGCLQCYLYCPDGAVYVVPQGDKRSAVAIDCDFCKGCGICVKECRFHALHMVSEQAALSRECALAAAVSEPAQALGAAPVSASAQNSEPVPTRTSGEE